MRILIGCEFSQIVTKAFRAKGHDAFSCDLDPTEGNPSWHLQYDVLDILGDDWDMGIFHPPCTRLAVSGARWFAGREKEQREALDFVEKLLLAPIDLIALENPIGVISTQIRKPDQIVQPWMFGHGETKAICLWLKNLPKLMPTNVVEGREHRIANMPPSNNRGKLRSVFYSGIADAMADQWGSLKFPKTFVELLD